MQGWLFPLHSLSRATGRVPSDRWLSLLGIYRLSGPIRRADPLVVGVDKGEHGHSQIYTRRDILLTPA